MLARGPYYDPRISLCRTVNVRSSCSGRSYAPTAGQGAAPPSRPWRPTSLRLPDASISNHHVLQPCRLSSGRFGSIVGPSLDGPLGARQLLAPSSKDRQQIVVQDSCSWSRLLESVCVRLSSKIRRLSSTEPETHVLALSAHPEPLPPEVVRLDFNCPRDYSDSLRGLTSALEEGMVPIFPGKSTTRLVLR